MFIAILFIRAKMWTQPKHIHQLVNGDFPGGPVVKTPRFRCRGHGFHPWSGN